MFHVDALGNALFHHVQAIHNQDGYMAWALTLAWIPDESPRTLQSLLVETGEWSIDGGAE